jgi:ribosomal protein S20
MTQTYDSAFTKVREWLGEYNDPKEPVESIISGLIAEVKRLREKNEGLMGTVAMADGFMQIDQAAIEELETERDDWKEKFEIEQTNRILEVERLKNAVGDLTAERDALREAARELYNVIDRSFSNKSIFHYNDADRLCTAMKKVEAAIEKGGKDDV